MTLTVVSKPSQGGSITCDPASDTGAYYPTDNVTVTATAKRGYRFVNWSGNVTEIEDTTQSTIVVAMDKYFAEGEKKIEITANFEKIIPWAWVAVGITSFVVAVLAIVAVILALRKKNKHQAETEAQ